MTIEGAGAIKGALAVELVRDLHAVGREVEIRRSR